MEFSIYLHRICFLHTVYTVYTMYSIYLPCVHIHSIISNAALNFKRPKHQEIKQISMGKRQGFIESRKISCKIMGSKEVLVLNQWANEICTVVNSKIRKL